MKPLAIDLFCGLGGWTEGLLAEGYRVVGFDNAQHVYGKARYPAQLVLQNVLTLHGSQFKDAALIVASPPCQAYSYRAMPWKKAKALPPPDNTLFEACFRIQREACEAAGRHIPLVVENVCGAQKWVGRAKWHYGSFYLWGDVPALMPIVRWHAKVGGLDWSKFGTPTYKAEAFNTTAEQRQQYTRLTNQYWRYSSRIIRLEDLLREIPIAVLTGAAQQFGEFRSNLSVQMGTPEAIEPVEDRQRLSLTRMCEAVTGSPVIRLHLPMFTEALARLQELVKHPIPKHEVAEHLSDAMRRLQDELKFAVFVWLDPDSLKYGQAALDDWSKSIAEFPLIKPDVAEALACLVFERPTASVFHLMRVMEFGLDKLRQMVRVPKSRPGWDSVIERIDTELKPKQNTKKSPTTRRKHRYIAEAVLLLRAVKEARNTTMHDFTKSYTIIQAEEQYRGVRNFMEKMADAV